jgi:hypothetical protein
MYSPALCLQATLREVRINHSLCHGALYLKKMHERKNSVATTMDDSRLQIMVIGPEAMQPTETQARDQTNCRKLTAPSACRERRREMPNPGLIK